MLEARNISYSYDDDSQALKNVSLKINDGEMAAILGKNGAGKSTLFLHFNGIHEPDDGEILIDGEKLKYNKKALIKCRQKVGIVFQNPDNQIFAPSVEEDVAFGPLNLKLPMDEVQNRVEEALKRVGMEGFEKKAPHHLSGGQKKRVAIAGILAMRPEIMILDEPTAALDALAEDRMYREFENMIKGKTAIFISHRLGSTRFCDKIAMFEDGMIVEEGTHEELMEKNGKYAYMFGIQSQYYEEKQKNSDNAESTETTNNGDAKALKVEMEGGQ